MQRDGLRPQKITAVELLELRGHYEAEAGVNGQTQVNPLDIYDEMRRPVYHDKPAGTRRVNTTAIYLRIKTAEGLEGLYGPIEREPAMVVWESWIWNWAWAVVAMRSAARASLRILGKDSRGDSGSCLRPSRL